MATIVTRAGKGSALTHAEGDANFTNLNTDKLENVSEDTTPTLGGELDANSNKIVNVTDPTADQDAATKLYVDNTVAGAAVTSSTATIIEVRNTTGTAIAKGVPVYIAGHSGTKILVAPADANDAAKMPAMGLMNATLSNNSDGEVISFGLLTGIDLSTFSIGDTLFVDTTPGGATFGGLTATAPTGETSAIQNLGKVARNVSNGEFIVSGPGRSNATPNLDEDQFFLGNASNQSVAVDFSDAVEALSINYGDLSVTTATDAETSALAYNNATGVFTFTPVDISDLTALDDFSVTTASASGGGSLSYNNTSGVFTFTPADASSLISLTDLSVTTGASAETSALSYNNSTGVFTFTPVETNDLIALDDLSVTTGSASGGGALSYNNTSGVISFTPADLSSKIELTNLSVTTAAVGETAALSYNNATGVFTFTPVFTDDLISLTELSVSTGSASGAGALSYNNTNGVFTFNPVDTSLVLANVSEDTTPQLGGDLDVNGNAIVSVSNGDIELTPNGTGQVVLGSTSIETLADYAEKLYTGNSTTGTITLDHEEGPLHYIVQTGALTIQGLATPTVGASVTLVLNNSGGSYTVAFDETNSTFYAVDGVDPTLTGFDMINLLCIDATTDAEVYLVNSVGDFASI